jgi:hypothetical protein
LDTAWGCSPRRIGEIVGDLTAEREEYFDLAAVHFREGK